MNPTLKWCNYQWVTTSLSVNRCHRCKINNCFSQYKRILADAPQGSILRLLLFNIIVNIFLSLQKSEIASYANDSTMYSTCKNINNVMTTLNYDFTILSIWFYIDLWSLILISAPSLCYLPLKTYFRQISYLTTLPLEIVLEERRKLRKRTGNHFW